MKNICERLLLKICSWNREKLKIVHKEFSPYIKKTQIFSTSISETNESVCFYFVIGFPWSLYSHAILSIFYTIKYIITTSTNTKYLLESIKRRSKVPEKNMSCERALKFDQWKTSENYKPMKVLLWLTYKFTENYCRLQLFSEFIQTQKRYRYLPW